MRRDYVTLAEAAREVGIPYTRLYYWMLSERIHARRMGQRNFVSLAEVKATMAAPGKESPQDEPHGSSQRQTAKA
jgi:hypothetical protein